MKLGRKTKVPQLLTIIYTTKNYDSINEPVIPPKSTDEGHIHCNVRTYNVVIYAREC